MRKEFQHKCAICGVDGWSNLGYHVIKTHNIPLEDYYRKYILEPGDPDGVCQLPTCNNPTIFGNLIRGYNRCCCRSHQLELRWIEDDGTLRQAAIENGRKAMTELNSWMWDDPEYMEWFRTHRNKDASDRMKKNE